MRKTNPRVLEEAVLCGRDNFGRAGLCCPTGETCGKGPNVPENAEIREKTWREEPGRKSAPFHAPWRQRERDRERQRETERDREREEHQEVFP